MLIVMQIMTKKAVYPHGTRKIKPTVASLTKKLDLVFGAYIRKRDEDLPCIDLCGRWGVHQAGHFRRRELKSTRWNEKNVNGQNAYCNCWDNDTYRHAKGIDKKWGKGTAEMLEKESRKTKQWTVRELEEKIEFYKNETRRLVEQTT